MFIVSNINPRYVIFCAGEKVFLSGCIENPKRRNIFIFLMLLERHSSYVTPNIIRSSMKIAVMIPSNLKAGIGDFLSLVNCLGPEKNPFGNTTNFKSLDPAKKSKVFCSFF